MNTNLKKNLQDLIDEYKANKIIFWAEFKQTLGGFNKEEVRNRYTPVGLSEVVQEANGKMVADLNATCVVYNQSAKALVESAKKSIMPALLGQSNHPADYAARVSNALNFLDRENAESLTDDVAYSIVNEYSGQLALMDDYDALVALYATYGLIPNKWAVDTFIDESAEKPNMVFSMSFAANDPEPSPEPEPEPTPTPDPEPKIIYRTRTVEKLVKEPEVEPATITNRKAVLKAPDSLFWTGYEIGHGGAGGTVTRADFAALMLSMMDDESRERYYTETAPFDDVAPGVWYAPAIGTATNAGFMLGCGLGVFQPERNLTWGELLTVFSRFTEEGTPPEIYTGNHWAKDAINTAISLEWISAGIDPGQTVTTGDLAGFVQTVFKWAEKS